MSYPHLRSCQCTRGVVLTAIGVMTDQKEGLHSTRHHIMEESLDSCWAYVALVTVCCHHRQHLQLRRSSLFVWPNSLVTARACYDRPRILHLNESIGQSCWIRSPRPMSHLQKSYQHALDVIVRAREKIDEISFDIAKR